MYLQSQVVGGEGPANLVAPFYDRRTVAEEVLFVSESFEFGDLLESVDVEVIEGKAPFIRPYDRKSRTSDRFVDT